MDESHLIERELDEEESRALKRFKRRDDKIDGYLEQIINNLGMMEEGLLNVKDVSRFSANLRILKKMKKLHKKLMMVCSIYLGKWILLIGR